MIAEIIIKASVCVVMQTIETLIILLSEDNLMFYEVSNFSFNQNYNKLHGSDQALVTPVFAKIIRHCTHHTVM